MTDALAASERLLLIFRLIEDEITVAGGLTIRRVDDQTMLADIPPPHTFACFLRDGEAVVHLFCDGLFDVWVTWRERDGCWDALCRLSSSVDPKSRIDRCIKAFGLDPHAGRCHPLTDLKAASLIISLARVARSG